MRDIRTLGIVRAMPNLSHLAIHGRLRMSDTSYYEDIDRERRGDGGVLQVRIQPFLFLIYRYLSPSAVATYQRHLTLGCLTKGIYLFRC